jgi:hypothetical protein
MPAVADRAGDIVKRLREGLDRSVFLPSSPEATQLKGWEGGLVLFSFLALAVVLQLFRIGPSEGLNSLWAEDGPVFFSGALTHGFFDTVTSTYAEYLVVAPRLIGEIGTLVPLHDATVAMNLTAALVVALCGLAVWFASAGHIRSPYLRALLVALTVLCPVSSIEAVVTPTNVAWYMTFAVFWLLFWRPATTWGACLGGLLIFATGVSTPATLFFLPIVLLRAVAIRGRRDVLIVGSYTLAMVIQLQAMLFNSEEVIGDIWTGNILTAFLQRVIDSAVLGVELGGSTWADWGWPFLIAIVVAVAAYLIVTPLRSSSRRLFVGIAVTTSVVMFLASGYTRALGDVMVWRADSYNSFGGRYAMVPTLLLLSAALVLIDSRYKSSRANAVAAFGVTAVLLVSIVTSFDVRGEIGRGGPKWDKSLSAATARCEAKDLAEVQVFTAPQGWSVPISCDRLVSTDDSERAR